MSIRGDGAVHAGRDERLPEPVLVDELQAVGEKEPDSGCGRVEEAREAARIGAPAPPAKP